MVSPGDNMAQAESEMPEEFYEVCNNCGDERWQHMDRQGCTGQIGPARCHCTNFEVKQSEA